MTSFDRTVLITGASSGIGEAAARAFATANYGAAAGEFGRK